MSPSRVVHVVVALVASTLLAGCRPPAARPSRTEFLVLAGDSSFWVRTTADGIRVRGSPIQLARYDGRFYEIYLADDDRSYTDASFVGERVYRRDLITGDSLLVFNDTTIAGLSRAWAAEHPDATPLGPDDDAPDEPSTSASSDFVILGQHGPYLSYEYRADVNSAERDDMHAMHRGVIDLRAGRDATLGEMFGRPESVRVKKRGAQLFAQAMDSVRMSKDARARAAVATLGDFSFDTSSFAVVADRRLPQVEFLAPGHGPQVGGFGLTLPPVSVAAPPWWAEVADAMPAVHDSSGDDRWPHDGLQLLSHDEGDGRGAAIVLIDSANRRWPAGRVSSPVWRVYWLGGPAVDSVSMRALARAFDDAALYSEDARTASFAPRADPGARRHPARLAVAARDDKAAATRRTRRRPRGRHGASFLTPRAPRA